MLSSRSHIFLLCSLILSTYPDSSNARTFQAIQYQPFEYDYQGQHIHAELGHFEVPERHSHPESNKITLAFLRLKTTSPNPGPPIIYLAGGPGGSAIRLAKGPRGAVFLRMRAAGDVIALEQRGVGLSKPTLDCGERMDFPLDQPGTLPALLAVYRAKARQCADDWKTRGVDLSAYTVVESAHDVESLRKALGVPKLRLWGSSYGTTLGLSVLRYHGDTIDRAILAGVEGPDSTLKYPRTEEHQLDTLTKLIVADPELHARIPDLRGLLRRVLQSAQSHPFKVMLQGQAGSASEVTLGRFDVEQIVIGMLGERAGLERLPRVLLELDRRNFTSDLVQEATKEIAEQRTGPVDSVMSLATDCSSGVSVERLAEIAKETRSGMLAHLDFPIPDLCPAIGVPELPSRDRLPVHSSVPTLFISGTLDGRTPLSNEEEVRQYFTRAQSVLIEGAGHGNDLFISSPEIAEVLVDYMATGKVDKHSIQLPPLRFR